MDITLETHLSDVRTIRTLSPRIYMALNRAGIVTVGDLIRNRFTLMDLLKQPNFGRKSLVELDAWVDALKAVLPAQEPKVRAQAPGRLLSDQEWILDGCPSLAKELALDYYYRRFRFGRKDLPADVFLFFSFPVLVSYFGKELDEYPRLFPLANYNTEVRAINRNLETYVATLRALSAEELCKSYCRTFLPMLTSSQLDQLVQGYVLDGVLPAFPLAGF